MTYILVPLYARGLGLSGVAIGTLVSAPVLVQIWLNLIAGAYTDRIGGKRMAIASCFATAMAGVLFGIATSFTGLLLGQLCLILGRSMFWPATWSIGTQIPGERSSQLGRLNAATSAGQIVGHDCGRMAARAHRVQSGFRCVRSNKRLGARCNDNVPRAGDREARSAADARHLLELAAAGARSTSPSCAPTFLRCPFRCRPSFYPILLVEGGYSSGAAGWLLALRALGQVAAGIGAGRYLRHITRRATPVSAALFVGLCVGARGVGRRPDGDDALHARRGLRLGRHDPVLSDAHQRSIEWPRARLRRWR